MMKLINTLAVENTLGEGIVWDEFRKCVWWTDIEESSLYQYFPEHEKLEKFEAPGRVSCLAPVERDGKIQDYLIVAFESSIAFYQPETGEVEVLAQIPHDSQALRLNDGRTDRQGRFWVGSMVEKSTESDELGKLYCLDGHYNLSDHRQGIRISNSICWSPDSKSVFHCDTLSRVIDKYMFDPKFGTFGEKLGGIKTQEKAFPDGSIVDADGFLWNAQWGASQIVRYGADGYADRVIELPVSQPTCMTFGGENLDYLFVTSAMQDLNQAQLAKEKNAGNVFIFKTPYRGLADSPFKIA